MILYTTTEAGDLKKLPFRTSHRKIMKQLYKHRVANRPEIKGYRATEYYSHITQSGRNPTIVVKCVYFVPISGLRNAMVWDADINGFRKHKNSPRKNKPYFTPKITIKAV